MTQTLRQTVDRLLREGWRVEAEVDQTPGGQDGVYLNLIRRKDKARRHEYFICQPESREREMRGVCDAIEANALFWNVAKKKADGEPDEFLKWAIESFVHVQSMTHEYTARTGWVHEIRFEIIGRSDAVVVLTYNHASVDRAKEMFQRLKDTRRADYVAQDVAMVSESLSDLVDELMTSERQVERSEKKISETKVKRKISLTDE